MAYRPYEAGEMSAGEHASELASPGTRLVAWIIDFAIILVIPFVAVLIVLALAGVESFDLTNLDHEFFWGALGVVVILTLLAIPVLITIQMVLLATRGQTIGKIIMKVRIVDAKTGAHPGWARIILLRTIVNTIIVSILNVLPGAGGAYFVVDSLFIFRADHRTIHDMIAGTRVDKVMD